MRIGVICEGPTDVHAIVNFLGASLTDRGVDPVFVTIQPESDRTKPMDGGWHAVLRWLIGNPPDSRVPSYFANSVQADFGFWKRSAATTEKWSHRSQASLVDLTSSLLIGRCLPGRGAFPCGGLDRSRRWPGAAGVRATFGLPGSRAVHTGGSRPRFLRLRRVT